MKLHYLLFVLALGMLTSCGEDCDDLSETIVGTWSSSLLGPGSFSFNSDGTLSDPDDVLFGFEINGVVYDQKTYTVSGNTISLRAETEVDANQFGSLDLIATEFDCETMTVMADGITVTLDKE